MGYDEPDALHSLQNIHNLQDVNTQFAGIAQLEDARMSQAMPDLRADDVIDRLRIATGTRTDIALADFFDIGNSAVSSWRARNKVPYAQCVNLALRKGLSLDWLLLGQHNERASADAGADPISRYGDPRAERLLRFVAAWQAGHDGDDMAWLERTIARAVPEYGEWLAAQKD